MTAKETWLRFVCPRVPRLRLITLRDALRQNYPTLCRGKHTIPCFDTAHTSGRESIEQCCPIAFALMEGTDTVQTLHNRVEEFLKPVDQYEERRGAQRYFGKRLLWHIDDDSLSREAVFSELADWTDEYLNQEKSQ